MPIDTLKNHTEFKEKHGQNARQRMAMGRVKNLIRYNINLYLICSLLSSALYVYEKRKIYWNASATTLRRVNHTHKHKYHFNMDLIPFPILLFSSLLRHSFFPSLLLFPTLHLPKFCNRKSFLTTHLVNSFPFLYTFQLHQNLEIVQF